MSYMPRHGNDSTQHTLDANGDDIDNTIGEGTLELPWPELTAPDTFTVHGEASTTLTHMDTSLMLTKRGGTLAHVTTGGITSTTVLTTDGDDTVLPAASLHVSCHSCRPSVRS
jgi:hypothetical protein